MKKMGAFDENGRRTTGTNGNGQSAYRSSVISIGSKGSAGHFFQFVFFLFSFGLLLFFCDSSIVFEYVWILSIISVMNGLQRTACLAKGYIDIELARSLTTTDSGSQNRR